MSRKILVWDDKGRERWVSEGQIVPKGWYCQTNPKEPPRPLETDGVVVGVLISEDIGASVKLEIQPKANYGN